MSTICGNMSFFTYCHIFPYSCCMESMLNPFSPGSGVKPPALEGREAEIDAFDLLIARTKQRRPNRSMLMTGLRGVGKTVLLNQFVSQAGHHSWPVVSIEAQPGEGGQSLTRKAFARALSIAGRKLGVRGSSNLIKDAVGTIASFGLSVAGTGLSVGLQPRPGRADSGVLDIDLEELVEDVAIAMAKENKAFIVFIDELQDLDEELLGALITVQHRAGQKSLPFHVIGAGLPNLPGRLSAVRSYAERLFDYRFIGPLVSEAAEAAVVRPMTRYGIEFEAGAVDVLVRATAGYPYFLQEFGSALWEIAPQKRITVDDARLAVEVGTQRLDTSFFVARWQRATKGERAYLRAMADDGDAGSSTSTIAGRLGKQATSYTPTRAKLIEKGLIYAPDQGRVNFTVPAMSAFIQRQYGA